MIDLALAAGIGLALGVVTGMPIGVVNVAIINAATRGQQRFAIGVGIGGALADTMHAAVAFVGVGRLITQHPSWSKLLAIVAAGVIIAYALLARRPRERAIRSTHGIATGVLLTLPNPAALGAWVAVAAVLWPQIALAPALALAFGVGIGSALWFVMLARVIAKLPREHRITRALPAIATALLVAIALIGVARALL